MPMPAVDNQKYQVRIKWDLHNQECLNVFSFIAHGTPDLVTDLLEAVLECFTTNLLPILSDEVTLKGADVKTIEGGVMQEAEVLLTADNDGQVASESIPSTNAHVIALRTEHPGRTGRGRLFLPGIPESLQQESEVDATFVAAAVAFLACMFLKFKIGDPPAANQFYWAINSRKDNAFYPIVSGLPRPIVATMRSRKRGV